MPPKLMAGGFGLDWRVAETMSRGPFVEYPAWLEVTGSFCEAIQSVFNPLAVPWVASVLRPGLLSVAGLLLAAPCSISVHGDRFVVVETDKVGSLDKLRQLLHAGEPSYCLYRA
jgi:hypothetical protein